MKKKILAVSIAVVLLCGTGIAAAACARSGVFDRIAALLTLVSPRREPHVTFDEINASSPAAGIETSLTEIMRVSNTYFDAHPDCAFLLAGYGEEQLPYLSDSGRRLSLTDEEKRHWKAVAGLMQKAGYTFGSVERREGYFLFCADAEPYAIVYAENDRRPPKYLFRPDEEQKTRVFKLADHWYEAAWY